VRFLVSLYAAEGGRWEIDRERTLGSFVSTHTFQRVHWPPEAYDLFCFFMFQIAPSTKKLWGVDEGGSKDEGGVKGGGTLLHLGDHPTTMWRDSTWSTTSGTICAITFPMHRPLVRFRSTQTTEVLTKLEHVE